MWVALTAMMLYVFDSQIKRYLFCALDCTSHVVFNCVSAWVQLLSMLFNPQFVLKKTIHCNSENIYYFRNLWHSRRMYLEGCGMFLSCLSALFSSLQKMTRITVYTFPFKILQLIRKNYHFFRIDGSSPNS